MFCVYLDVPYLEGVAYTFIFYFIRLNMDGLIRLICDDADLVYKMTRKTRGRLVIINNKSFDKKLNLADRPESDVDAESLCNVFTKMGFTYKVHVNKTREQMLEIIKQGKCFLIYNGVSLTG